MADHPTSAQYAIGVPIGRLLTEALAAGATHRKIVATLHNSIGIVEFDEAIQRSLCEQSQPRQEN